jgi:uncharacterized membrane protein
MSGLGHIVAAVATLTNGVAAGIMLSTVIGIVPMMLALPYGRYVQTVQFLWPRYDPIMPITNGATMLLDAVLAIALIDRAPVRVIFGLAALVQLTVMAISITRNVPVNRYVKSLDPARQPTDWATADPRRRWRSWNLIRTGLALLAFAMNVTAVVLLG